MSKKAKAKAVEVENESGETEQVETVPTITLKEICDEMGIKTSAARVKLRKKLKDDPSRDPKARWVFPLERKDEIVGLLTAAPKAEDEAEDGENGEDGGEGSED